MIGYELGSPTPIPTAGLCKMKPCGRKGSTAGQRASEEGKKSALAAQTRQRRDVSFKRKEMGKARALIFA
jgi:hypothetical protein